MIVYVPTPITSVEQAEALPEGSAVVRLDTPWIATKRGPDENGHTWWESKNGIYDHGDVLRETALVPIEAEEEYSTDRATFAWDNDAIYSSPQNVRRDGWVDPLQRRFTTMWETVTDPDRRGDCA